MTTILRFQPADLLQCRFAVSPLTETTDALRSIARFGGEGIGRWCVGRSREYRADVVAASAVRFPRGLFDALRLMEQAPEPAGNSVFGPSRFGATRYVWIDPSVGHRADPVVPGDLDATSVRAAALSEW